MHWVVGLGPCGRWPVMPAAILLMGVLVVGCGAPTAAPSWQEADADTCYAAAHGVTTRWADQFTELRDSHWYDLDARSAFADAAKGIANDLEQTERAYSKYFGRSWPSFVSRLREFEKTLSRPMTKDEFSRTFRELDDFVTSLFFGGMPTERLDGACDPIRTWVDENVRR